MYSKVFLAIFILLIVTYLGVAVYRFANQSRFVYFPIRDIAATPRDAGMDYEDIYFHTEDGVKINGWFIPEEGSRFVLLLFHGNGGNISHRLELIRVFKSIGLSVFIIDYRGYGNSQGSPTEEGTYLDAQAAMRYLEEDRGLKEEEIVVYGRSLGGAVAAHMASSGNPAALILDSTFTSIKDIGAELYPFLPVRRFFRFEYDTLDFVSGLNCPVLVIHSKDDEYIPYQHAQRIYSEIKTRKEIVAIKGSHNDGFLVSSELYREKISEFLKLTNP
ncbi:MAG: alpha/beta hydrolase [Actinomycetota bacterium]